MVLFIPPPKKKQQKNNNNNNTEPGFLLVFWLSFRYNTKITFVYFKSVDGTHSLKNLNGSTETIYIFWDWGKL